MASVQQMKTNKLGIIQRKFFLAIAVLTVLSVLFFSKDFLFLFLIYHGNDSQKEIASRLLVRTLWTNTRLIEKHLKADEWFVRYYLFKAIGMIKAKGLKDFALRIINDRLEKEQDRLCQYEIAVALIKFGEPEKAKPLLWQLQDDDKVGSEAKEMLGKLQ